MIGDPIINPYGWEMKTIGDVCKIVGGSQPPRSTFIYEPREGYVRLMRVGELVKLNRSDIDFENRECIVLGKGNMQRKVYFDARTKIHLQNHLASRTDENEAMFVSMQKPYNRLLISGVEIRLRELGK